MLAILMNSLLTLVSPVICRFEGGPPLVSIWWCNGLNLDEGCLVEENVPSDHECNLIPDSNAKGDVGSSVTVSIQRKLLNVTDFRQIWTGPHNENSEEKANKCLAPFIDNNCTVRATDGKGEICIPGRWQHKGGNEIWRSYRLWDQDGFPCNPRAYAPLPGDRNTIGAHIDQ